MKKRDDRHRSAVQAPFTANGRNCVWTVVEIRPVRGSGISGDVFAGHSDISGRTVWWCRSFKGFNIYLISELKISFLFCSHTHFYFNDFFFFFIAGWPQRRGVFRKQSSSDTKKTASAAQAREEEETLIPHLFFNIVIWQSNILWLKYLYIPTVQIFNLPNTVLFLLHNTRM